MRSLRTAATVVVATLALGAAAASAQEPQRVRGTIASLEGSTLTVTSREGPAVPITLSPTVGIRGIRAASADDIKPGDFVGVASVPDASGAAGALEVLIFPAAMKGSGEGSYPWDLQPNSTMTNATVANAVEDVAGRKLTLSYPTGTKEVTLPDGIPVVTFGDADMADLKAGATVFVPAQRGADGTLSTAFVVVGNDGIVPPM